MDDHRGLRIGQPVFQAITDFDAQFALVTGNDQQRAVVLVLLPNGPMTTELDAIILDGGALQIGQRDHDQLLTARLFVGLQLLAQLRAHRWLDHLRLVHHAPAQRRERQLGPGADGEHPQHQHQAYFQHTHGQPRIRTSLAGPFPHRAWWLRRFRASAGRCTSRCARGDRERCGSRCCTSAPPE
ncbi:hypothetical protein SRM1_01311 [Pseudomonas fluorescens]|nr:hypothetical protein SRM1_01311 [Pseudomonas fluorescens]